MNRKKKIIIGSLVLIVIIMILCVFGYFIYRGKYNKISNTIDQDNNKAELSTELKEQEAILIREQFLAKLKEIDKISDEKLLDYRVDEVKILSDSEKQVFNENEEYRNSPRGCMCILPGGSSRCFDRQGYQGLQR